MVTLGFDPSFFVFLMPNQTLTLPQSLVYPDANPSEPEEAYLK